MFEGGPSEPGALLEADTVVVEVTEVDVVGEAEDVSAEVDVVGEAEDVGGEVDVTGEVEEVTLEVEVESVVLIGVEYGIAVIGTR